MGTGIVVKPAILEIDLGPEPAQPLLHHLYRVCQPVCQASELSLEVANMMGQVVYRADAGKAAPGLNKLTIDGSQLSNGVYFYTVPAGEARVIRKMIVE
jgi:hypothetical protein